MMWGYTFQVWKLKDNRHMLRDKKDQIKELAQTCVDPL